MAKQVVDLKVVVVHRTEKAILVKLDEDAEKIWLPLAPIDVDPEDCISGIATIVVPVALAQDKGPI